MIINVNNLSYCYSASGEYVFEGVSVQLDTDYRLGLVGRNGRGKTTFLRLLAGELCDGGAITRPCKMWYFPFSVDENALVVDAVSDCVSDFELWKLQRELNLLCVDPDCLYRPVNTLSGGERTKVLLAALFLHEGGFFLIDEPTNHLDAEARAVVGQYLRRKSGFVLVSHDRTLLDACTTHTLAINRAGIVLERGNFSSYQANKDRQDSFELAESKKLSAEISRLQGAAGSASDLSRQMHSHTMGKKAHKKSDEVGSKEFYRNKAEKIDSAARAMARRTDRLVAQKSSLLNNIEREEQISIAPLTHHADRLVQLHGVCVSYDTKKVLDNFNLQVFAGDRVRLSGKNGSGKSTALRLIAGEQHCSSGSVRLASGLIVSYVPQSGSGLCGNLASFADEVEDKTLFFTLLSKLDLPIDIRELSALSEGQKKKVLLARSICQRAHIYVWDEPLNYIDILTRIQIEKMLLANALTLIFTEHDQAFAGAIATREVLI